MEPQVYAYKVWDKRTSKLVRKVWFTAASASSLFDKARLLDIREAIKLFEAVPSAPYVTLKDTELTTRQVCKWVKG